MALSYTLGFVSKLLQEPQHRLINLCERGVVKPTTRAKGRGSVRRFSEKNLYLLAVACRMLRGGLDTRIILPAIKKLARRVTDLGGRLGITVRVGPDKHCLAMTTAPYMFVAKTRSRVRVAFGTYTEILDGDTNTALLARIDCSIRVSLHFSTLSASMLRRVR